MPFSIDADGNWTSKSETNVADGNYGTFSIDADGNWNPMSLTTAILMCSHSPPAKP
ncbi:VCBS domain-containing protein [Shewanella xiamenensis]|uniref:VCBS domain-containing protein n=1 Tax=Shewanella xiamenensis TaxID=332186 RepID=UPI002948E12B|nr:VCBS domain-containing protein [Shewanella xiamenensis]MDV5246394.1 VCBS domain-containing protein [Shewanella xiamenensis]